MSAPGASIGAHPFSAGFLKAWVDQASAIQDLFARLADQTSAGLPPSMPPPHLAPWKAFVDGLGMGRFNPAELMPGAPALGLTREFQENARRLIELDQIFPQR